jgi:transposase-like protein
MTSREHTEIKRLKRDVAELRRANEILKAAALKAVPTASRG